MVFTVKSLSGWKCCDAWRGNAKHRAIVSRIGAFAAVTGYFRFAEIEAYPDPHAEFRFVVDSRRPYQKLPGRQPQSLGEAGAAWVFAENLAIFDVVILDHPARDFCGSAGRHSARVR